MKWKTRWMASSAGERVGPALLACRFATALSWVHDNIYLPLGVTNGGASGRCGFCMFGTSAGSSPIAYALTHYGLEDIVDASVPHLGACPR